MKNLSNICRAYANMICGNTVDGFKAADIESIAKEIEDTVTFVYLLAEQNTRLTLTDEAKNEDSEWMFLTHEQAEEIIDEEINPVYPIIELDLVVGMGLDDDDEKE